jgi:hypothetical protein
MARLEVSDSLNHDNRHDQQPEKPEEYAGDGPAQRAEEVN